MSWLSFTLEDIDVLARAASGIIIVVLGVGVDVAYREHAVGFYVAVSSGLIFFLEIIWAITLFVEIFIRNDESFCKRYWPIVVSMTRGWRRALFYLPLSCIMAWKPYSLNLSYVAAGLLVVLSLLHITSSTYGGRAFCRAFCRGNATDSVDESLLNVRVENFDRFEEVLVTEVLDDYMSGQIDDVLDSEVEI